MKFRLIYLILSGNEAEGVQTKSVTTNRWNQFNSPFKSPADSSRATNCQFVVKYCHSHRLFLCRIAVTLLIAHDEWEWTCVDKQWVDNSYQLLEILSPKKSETCQRKNNINFNQSYNTLWHFPLSANFCWHCFFCVFLTRNVSIHDRK